MTQQKTVLNWLAVIGMCILVVGSFTWMSPQEVSVPTADEIADAIADGNIVLDEDGEMVVAETLDVDKFNEFYDAYFAQDAWEAEAKVIAEEEYEDNDHKDLFNAMEDLLIDIDDRDDIDKVIVKDTTYSNIDADKKEGTVIQELKVYYEDSDNDDEKEYIYVQTTFEDGEIDDQDFSLTPF